MYFFVHIPTSIYKDVKYLKLKCEFEIYKDIEIVKYSSVCLMFFSKIEISTMNLIGLKPVFPGSWLLNKEIGSRFKHKESEPNRIKLNVTVILYSVTQSRNHGDINDSLISEPSVIL